MQAKAHRALHTERAQLLQQELGQPWGTKPTGHDAFIIYPGWPTSRGCIVLDYVVVAKKSVPRTVTGTVIV